MPRAARRKFAIFARWEAVFNRILMSDACNHHGHTPTPQAAMCKANDTYGSRVRSSCERENSSTGHIVFFEYINAAALPFARKPCNIDDEPVLYILSFMWPPLFSVFHTTSLRFPASPTRPRPTTSSAGRAAPRSSHRSHPSKRAVPVEHLRAQHGRAISRLRGSRAHTRNSGLATGEASTPKTPDFGHS